MFGHDDFTPSSENEIKDRGEAGFTLIEMLVALVIFSLLSVGATTAMISSLRTKAQLDQAIYAVKEIETARALMKSDISNLVLRPNRDPYGNPEQYILSGGAETVLTFTRSGRENPGGLEKRGALQRVAYVFENDALIRRAYSVDNPAPLTPLHDRVLVSDLENVFISFEDDNQSFRQIYVPNDQSSLPVNLMILTLRFSDGDELVQKFEMDPQ